MQVNPNPEQAITRYSQGTQNVAETQYADALYGDTISEALSSRNYNAGQVLDNASIQGLVKKGYDLHDATTAHNLVITYTKNSTDPRDIAFASALEKEGHDSEKIPEIQAIAARARDTGNWGNANVNFIGLGLKPKQAVTVRSLSAEIFK